MRWHCLDEALWAVRNLLPALPDVLVLVMIPPGPRAAGASSGSGWETTVSAGQGLATGGAGNGLQSWPA